MANDYSLPSLALSDIMHPMSPSPAPPQLADALHTTLHRDASPEPLSEADIAGMRRRISEMGFGPSEKKANESSRERELLDMVLRLTDSPLVDPSQLIRQAGLIYELTLQRDFLIRQAEEDRDRWDSEKAGWDRMAEALIAQRHKPGNSGHKEEELERQCSSFQSDNRNLRARLLDTQNRLSSLESELKNLKPLLLMQPVPSVSSSSRDAPSSSANPTYVSTMTLSAQAVAASKGKPGRKRKSALDEAIHEQQEISADEAAASTSHMQAQHQAVSSSSSATNTHSQGQPIAGPSSSSGQTGASVYHYLYPYKQHLPPQQSQHVHTAPTTFSVPLTSTSSHSAAPASSTAAPPSKKQRASKSTRKPASTLAPLLPLTSDARTEHILLAARRIGRERAGMVAGIMKAVEKEKEKLAREQEAARIARETEKLERERLERLASGTAGMGYYRMDGSVQGGHVMGPGQLPTTPKRGGEGGIGASHYTGSLAVSAVPPASSFVFVGTPASSGYAGSGVMGTPRQVAIASRGEGQQHHQDQQQQQPQQPQQNQQQSQSQAPPQQKNNLPHNPPTPLDSLLSAARSMMDDGDESTSEARRANKGNGSGNGSGNVRRKANSIEMPESPLPKRRRVGTGKVAGGDRVRSALDVLADQAAAAFPEADQSQSQSVGPSSSVTAIGNAKVSVSTTKTRGKAKTKEAGGAQNNTSASSAATGEGREESVSSAPTRGRPRGSKDKAKAKALAAATTSTVAAARKPRPRPPPRDRTAALSASGLTPSTVGVKGKGREESMGSRSATPRMIASAAPRLIASGGSGTGGKRSGMSPLDEALPPLVPKRREKKGSGGHTPWVDTSASSTTQRRSGTPSLRPVVGWGANERDQMTSSSPPRVSGQEKDAVTEAEMAVEMEAEAARKDVPDVQVEAEPEKPPEAEKQVERVDMRMEMDKPSDVGTEVVTDEPPDALMGVSAVEPKGREPDVPMPQVARNESLEASSAFMGNETSTNISPDTSKRAAKPGRSDSPLTTSEPKPVAPSSAELQPPASIQETPKASPDPLHAEESKAASSAVNNLAISSKIPEMTNAVEVDPSILVVSVEEVHDIDADAEDDDEDAEGEKDEDAEKDKDKKESENEPVSETRDRPPPSRTPPPPGPPPSAPNGGTPPDTEEDHDTDADAEGEVDYEAEEPSHTSSSGTSLNLICMPAKDAPVSSFNRPPPPTTLSSGPLGATLPVLATPISLSSDSQGQAHLDLGFGSCRGIQDDRRSLASASADSERYLVAAFAVADVDANRSIADQGQREEHGVFQVERSSTEMNMTASNSATAAAVRHPGVLVVEGRNLEMALAGKQMRSPYVKWTRKEDSLLVEAVSGNGEKWDMVKDALPSRNYYQIRQRWLRLTKKGLFNSKSDFSLFPTGPSYYGDLLSPSLKRGLDPLSRRERASILQDLVYFW